VRLETEASIAPVPEEAKQNDIILGADKGLQIAEYLGIESAELRSAVVYIGCGHSELGCRQ